MKSHATIGAETLDAALREYPGATFLQMARDIAATHHERYDGAGYPNGLRGDGIPLCGRIVALADVYDALTSKRIYKDAYRSRTCADDYHQRIGQPLRSRPGLGVPAMRSQVPRDPRGVQRRFDPTGHAARSWPVALLHRPSIPRIE